MLRRTFLICAPLLLASSIAWARRALWNPSQRPPVSLQRALALADAELKKERVDYFCIGATLAKSFSEGDWELQYSSKDGKRMWVSVGSDQRVRTSREGFNY